MYVLLDTYSKHGMNNTKRDFDWGVSLTVANVHGNKPQLFSCSATPSRTKQIGADAGEHQLLDSTGLQAQHGLAFDYGDADEGRTTMMPTAWHDDAHAVVVVGAVVKSPASAGRQQQRHKTRGFDSSGDPRDRTGSQARQPVRRAVHTNPAQRKRFATVDPDRGFHCAWYCPRASPNPYHTCWAKKCPDNPRGWHVQIGTGGWRRAIVRLWRRPTSVPYARQAGRPCEALAALLSDDRAGVANG